MARGPFEREPLLVTQLTGARYSIPSPQLIDTPPAPFLQPLLTIPRQSKPDTVLVLSRDGAPKALFVFGFVTQGGHYASVDRRGDSCLMTATPALAQATSTFNGRVLDQGDAVLPGVTVTVTNVATGVVRDHSDQRRRRRTSCRGSSPACTK